MRRTLPLTLVMVAFSSLAASAAGATDVGYSRKFGLGLMLGDPTGLTAKYWVAQKNALDFGIGFASYGYRARDCWTDSLGRVRCDRYGYGHTSLNVDYLWHPSVLARGSVELDWHIGVGG